VTGSGEALQRWAGSGARADAGVAAGSAAWADVSGDRRGGALGPGGGGTDLGGAAGR
jgi:hypothetical protein